MEPLPTRAPEQQAGHPSGGRGWIPTMLLGLTLVIAAVLTLHGLGNNAFWDDEANTALFARNWLRTGNLTAFDGVNVIGYRQGAELNEKLENIYMPPMQYYVAAWGLKWFGAGTIGGRLPFVFAGLLSILAVALFVRWHLGERVPPWVASGLLALSPAYLMFVRQCRYYSIAVLLTVVVLAALACGKSTARARVLGVFVAALSAWLLMFTNYLDAVALAAILPLFLVLRRYRNRVNFYLVGAVYVSLLVAGIYVLRTANPLATSVTYKDTITGVHRLWLLFVWHISGLARFEFFAVVPPVLGLGALLYARQSLVAILFREMLLLCAVLFVYSTVIVVFSPQTVTGNTKLADMRYVVPLIPMGAVATACALCALWHSSVRSGPIASLVTASVLVGTNAFSSAIAWSPLRSTLYEYVLENAHDYITGNEEVVRFLQHLERSYVIRVIPDFMTYPAMFYVPTQRYCCQLPDDFPIRKKSSVVLPNYVFNTRILPDYILVGADIEPQQLMVECTLAFGPGKYHVSQILGSDYRDSSRPEIPWHSFGPPRDRKRGFTVLERTGLRGH